MSTTFRPEFSITNNLILRLVPDLLQQIGPREDVENVGGSVLDVMPIPTAASSLAMSSVRSPLSCCTFHPL